MEVEYTMNTAKKMACVIALLATTSTSVMAESIDVRVIGTITPTACTPSITGGGTIDYGSISPKSLKKDVFNYLEVKSVDFAITCDAPAKVALQARAVKGANAVGADGRLWSVARDIPLFGGVYDAHGLGLTSDNKGIGGFGLRFETNTIIADSNKVDSIIQDGNTPWVKSPDGSLIKGAGIKRLYSWSKAGEVNPVAFTTLTGTLNVQAYINKTSELDLTKPVRLDGVTTLELVYL